MINGGTSKVLTKRQRVGTKYRLTIPKIHLG